MFHYIYYLSRILLKLSLNSLSDTKNFHFLFLFFRIFLLDFIRFLCDNLELLDFINSNFLWELLQKRREKTEDQDIYGINSEQIPKLFIIDILNDLYYLQVFLYCLCL